MFNMKQFSYFFLALISLMILSCSIDDGSVSQDDQNRVFERLSGEWHFHTTYNTTDDDSSPELISIRKYRYDNRDIFRFVGLYGIQTENMADVGIGVFEDIRVFNFKNDSIVEYYQKDQYGNIDYDKDERELRILENNRIDIGYGPIEILDISENSFHYRGTEWDEGMRFYYYGFADKLN